MYVCICHTFIHMLPNVSVITLNKGPPSWIVPPPICINFLIPAELANCHKLRLCWGPRVALTQFKSLGAAKLAFSWSYLALLSTPGLGSYTNKKQTWERNIERSQLARWLGLMRPPIYRYPKSSLKLTKVPLYPRIL